MNEVLLIDKPTGWTSFDVVAKIRGRLRGAFPGKKLRVGHAGTLDPFATGLLIILTGTETKNQDCYMKQDKEYEATLRLGATSTTGDPEGEIKENPNTAYQIPNQEAIKKVLEKFNGEIEQTPPAYSAIKIDGQRAYKLARAGVEVKIKSRKVKIYELSIMNYEFPHLSVRVKCSSGTYIRTLAEDIGKAIGCGAYLTALRRTKIGEFKIKNAQTVNEILESAFDKSSEV